MIDAVRSEKELADAKRKLAAAAARAARKRPYATSAASSSSARPSSGVDPTGSEGSGRRRQGWPGSGVVTLIGGPRRWQGERRGRGHRSRRPLQRRRPGPYRPPLSAARAAAVVPTWRRPVAPMDRRPTRRSRPWQPRWLADRPVFDWNCERRVLRVPAFFFAPATQQDLSNRVMLVCSRSTGMRFRHERQHGMGRLMKSCLRWVSAYIHDHLDEELDM